MEKTAAEKKIDATGGRILIIDDEENMRHMLRVLLVKAGYHVEEARDGQEGIVNVQQSAYDFILCDLRMPNLDGMTFIRQAADLLENTTVIMMSAYGTIDEAVEAMKLGAYDFISKPFKPDEVLLILKNARERDSLKRENRLLRTKLKNIEEIYNFGKMVAKSKAMQAVFSLAEKVAQYDTTVLITGESGTGKELIALGIHYSGARKEGVLIPVNCGGIPETLLESELFGHVKGAFTGAEKDKKGLFEEAHGGTIFLDEIGELPVALQVKLLRVLQENEIRPVGGSKPKKIDVRILAATAKALQDEVRKGLFREDLYYRLNVVTIKLPALRERKEDIPLLSQKFMEDFNQKLGKGTKTITPQAMALLMNHSWPGNVRELENMIERAMVLAEGDVLLPENFPSELKNRFQEMSRSAAEAHGLSLKEAQKRFEMDLIVKALKQTGGNRTQAAKLLEISHPSLLSKMKTYSIDM